MLTLRKLKDYFFPRRRLWKNWRYWTILPIVFFEQRKAFPTGQCQIESLSRNFQEEHRYEREKLLIKHALKLFPTWTYAQQRSQWLSKPVFHLDPNKSKVQPRKSTKSKREFSKTPKSETLASLCIVTGMSSNAPYLELGLQLIESIKATEFYKQIPIKILDCGLNQEHKDYLTHRFQVEIKDPDWDVDPGMIVSDSSYDAFPKNGWKGCTARPYLHQHFPGFDYYLWIDADSWIKDETGLDDLVCLAEKQGAGFLTESRRWNSHSFLLALTTEKRILLTDKKVMFNGIFCFSQRFMTLYGNYADENLRLINEYRWGFDMVVFNLTIYHFIKEPKWVYCYISQRASGRNEKIVILEGCKKFGNSAILYLDVPHRSKAFLTLSLSDAEDISAIYSKKYGIKRESSYFREYP